MHITGFFSCGDCYKLFWDKITIWTFVCSFASLMLLEIESFFRGLWNKIYLILLENSDMHLESTMEHTKYWKDIFYRKWIIINSEHTNCFRLENILKILLFTNMLVLKIYLGSYIRNIDERKGVFVHSSFCYAPTWGWDRFVLSVHPCVCVIIRVAHISSSISPSAIKHLSNIHLHVK